MREKVAIIGAGSAMFTRGLVADLIGRGWESDLALVDTDPRALETAHGLVKKMIEAKRAPLRLSASTDRRRVLPGATAVICTIGVGGRRAWEKDVFIPRKHGIFQPVGDTVMPGGTSRALRMIPPMVSIARDVLDLAPGALFFNYGNPMAPVCRAIRKATGARIVGLCHGVFGVAGYLAEQLGVDRKEMRWTAVGMNHLTWFTEVRARGTDAMPRLREIARKKLAVKGRKDNPFSWELLLLFGGFPACMDRHVSEFFPWLFPRGRYQGKTLGLSIISLEETIEWGDRIYAAMRRDALSRRPLGDDYFEKLSGEHEQVLDIIESIRNDAGDVYSANLPNTGTVPNLPNDAILETPTIATGAGLKAIAQPPLPAGIAGTLATRLCWVETVVEAALEGSRDKFVAALVLDGAVSSLRTAAALADDLLAAHAKYLPRFRAARSRSPA
jgi:alpha-galactosidase